MSGPKRSRRPPARRGSGKPAARTSPSTAAFRERIGALERELGEAREREAATGEVLQLIAESPADLPAVLDGILAGAIRLVGAHWAAMSRFDGALFHLVAQRGATPEFMEVAASVYPFAPDPAAPSTKAVTERSPVYIEDALEAAYRGTRDLARAAPFRSLLTVPLLREGRGIGTINLAWPDVRPFPAERMDVLRAFANQAVIAIENARLFTELDKRNRDLTDALDQQTATSEILRAISRAVAEIQPVFDAIAESARRLCGGQFSAVFRFDGILVHFVAHSGWTEAGLAAFQAAYPMPPNRDSPHGLAILGRRVVHVRDSERDPDVPPAWLPRVRALGTRSFAAIPIVCDGEPVGSIGVGRDETGGFTDQQIALLETFADQAAIAIENVRLFTELEVRNRDLGEALERQTATAEILRVISSSPTDGQPVFDTIARSASRLCGGMYAIVTRFDGELMHLVAQHNPRPGASGVAAGLYPRRPDRAGSTGRAILARAVVHIPDVAADPDLAPAISQGVGAGSLLGVPMLHEGQPIGAIGVSRPHSGPFPQDQIDLLKVFADQAVIAIENVRLFTELEKRNAALTQSLDRQTATADILRAISGSRTDVQPVFDAIVRNAVQLCAGLFSTVFRFDGERMHVTASQNTSPQGLTELQRIYPAPPSRGLVAGRAILEGAVVHVPDIELDAAEWLSEQRQVARVIGWRSALIAPMLREGAPIGAITVARAAPGRFSDSEIELLRTFADQAVIAIENARLLSELEARTSDLTRSVDRLMALGEVGRAVSSSLDLETVLTTIVSRAVELSGLDGGSIFEYDEAREDFELRASLNADDALVTAQREARPRKGEGVVGRTALTLEPAQIEDIAALGAYEGRLRESLLRAGARALLAVPLLREGRLLGSLAVIRNRPGAFAPDVVQLLATFATQSALAIQNARLFRELEEKGRELETASRHKSEFLANMSHELRTPLNAIIGYSEMLEEDAAELDEGRLVPDIQKVHAAGKHLLELINSVLDLSKIEAGKMELYLEEFDVAGLVRDIAAVVKPLAEKKQNRLEVVQDPAAGTMRADLTKVRQALFNLLSNACKFTERGTVTLAVARERTGAGDWLVFEVRDTGIGMTAEQMGRLFQEFGQADASVGRRYGGTGLGLALSRRLARMMGGDIALRSELGRGSTFTLRLPAETPEIPRESAEVGTASPSASGTGLAGTVLVIDNEPDVRDLLQRFLAREGFRVVTAAGAEEGIARAREVHPDAITLDVLMPGMDGWAALTALKSSPETADIPVVMLTILDDRNLGHALGAADYLPKPIDRDRLVAALARYRRDLPVLLVDDDVDFRQLVRRVLERDGFAVVEAENGRVALDRVREARPGLILLDLLMPEVDGFALVLELGRHAEWRQIPVVVLTAVDLSAEDRQRLHGQVERVLEKGGSSRDSLLTEVRDIVTALVSRRRTQPGPAGP